VGTVFPALIATNSRGKIELWNLYVPCPLRCVKNVCLGEFHADSTIFKYFNANFVVLFHMFFVFGKLSILGSNWNFSLSVTGGMKYQVSIIAGIYKVPSEMLLELR
jgi:hypothetical protein